MTQSWRKVWGRRQAQLGEALDLARLLRLDGYDTGAAAVDEDAYRDYARAIAHTLRIGAGTEVYEVGCGSGALLLALAEGAGASPGGCDFSPALLEVARAVLPGGTFDLLDADALPTAPTVDVVLAKGVFHYFPTEDYAARVLSRMLAKARHAVGILETPNLLTRDEAERLRRDRMTPAVYEETYRGLEHRYYDPAWLADAARASGWRCEILPHAVRGYAQSPFRFDAVLHRDE